METASKKPASEAKSRNFRIMSIPPGFWEGTGVRASLGPLSEKVWVSDESLAESVDCAIRANRSLRRQRAQREVFSVGMPKVSKVNRVELLSAQRLDTHRHDTTHRKQGDGFLSESGIAGRQYLL